jgi:hypothetical protein
MVWLRRMGSRATWLEIAQDVTFQACPTRLSLISNNFAEELYNRFSGKAVSGGIPIAKMNRFADAIMEKSEVGLDNCVAFLDTKAPRINKSYDYLQ